MILYKNKQVVVHNEWQLADENWYNDYDAGLLYKEDNHILFDPTENDIANKVKQAWKTSIPNGSILYFDKTSKFPRYKLTDTSYKRCIKPEKSDYQIIGKLPYFVFTNAHLFEGENKYYLIIDPDKLSSYYWTANWNRVNVPDKLQYIINENNFEKRNIKLVYTGQLCYAPSRVYTILSNIVNGIFPNPVKDKDLDSIINNTMENMTIDDVDLLFDMLNSTDMATMELGLKMLVGYNINDIPVTVRLLLYNPNLKDTNSWNSVGVKQVKATCGYKSSGWTLSEQRYYAFEDNMSEKDREYSYHIWKKILIPKINKQIGVYDVDDLKFTCHAE